MPDSLELRSRSRGFRERLGSQTLVALVGAAALVACNLFAGEDFTSSRGGAGASATGSGAADQGNGGAKGGAAALGGSSSNAGASGSRPLGGSSGTGGASSTGGSATEPASTGGSGTGGSGTGGSGTGGRAQNTDGGASGAAPTAGKGGSQNGGAATGGHSSPTGGVSTGGTTAGSGGTAGAIGVSGGVGSSTGGAVNTTGGVPTCGGEVLRNGDFENGSTGWTAKSNWPGADQVVVSADNAVLKSEGVKPYSGNALAWLGGIPDSSTSHRITMTQEIELPATTTSLTLTGYSLIHTEEPDLGNTFDSAYIEIILATSEDDETVLFVTDPFFTPSDATTAWVAIHRAIETTEWKQLKLLFRITSNSDDGYKTHFWFDKLSLIATCGR
jgi:hypothetical protein